MPSTISIEENKYYANTNNQFWDIIYSIFNSKIHNDYKQRCEFLLDNKIALWDVLKYADREGNLDNVIVDIIIFSLQFLFYNILQYFLYCL